MDGWCAQPRAGAGAAASPLAYFHSLVRGGAGAEFHTSKLYSQRTQGSAYGWILAAQVSVRGPMPAPTASRHSGGMTSTILSARSLSKRYGAGIALNNVDVDIAAGESVAIMGASGSGKTTLLHTLAGITAPDSGTVNYAGTDVTALNETQRSKLRREAFGFVFQSGLLIPELTAIENVALALMLNGVSRRDAEPQAAAWLTHLGLAGMEGRRIGELSGGQAQRVAIARAQVTGAGIVFADEPTGALDSHTSAEVMGALLAATSGRGRTLVLVTHDPSVAARCSRTLYMHDGVLSLAPSARPAAERLIPTAPYGTAQP